MNVIEDIVRKWKIQLAAPILLIAIILIAGCINEPEPGPGPGPSVPTGNLSITSHASTQQMIRFSSQAELEQFLAEKEAGATSTTSRNFGGLSLMSEKAVAAPSAGAMADTISVEQGATDYSQTNVQYQNVDEADFIKNDDRYIYMVADNQLVIIDAYDAKNAQIISKTKISNEDTQDYYAPTARELFIKGNKLVLFVVANERTFYFQKYDVIPIPTYKQVTHVYIYDVTDRKHPILDKDYSVPGNYYQSRMIDDYVYLVTQDGASLPYVRWPMIMEGSRSIIKPDIYYFDNPDENYQFNTVTSLKVSDEKVVDSKTFMLGYSNTLMVSEKNIYIAYQKQDYWCYRWWGSCRDEGYDRARFFSVVVPLLKGDLKSQVDAITSQSLNENEEWQRISEALSQFYAKAADDEKYAEQYKDMLENVQEAVTEYDTKQQLEKRKTIIHKIGIKEGQIDYKAKGEVSGSLLNQFSLDEYQDNLRVATTVDVWAQKRVQYNNVYVLDNSMQLIGQVEKIAPDERIYSTRFIGETLYMVTFRQTDPFFVIDLSDPRNPEIKGALKVPGFSDYLHPYDSTHIIGIGKETSTDEYGTTRTKGLKIALFDVSDLTNPVQVDKVEIGEAGSDSPALHDHRAFLFSKSKNLLVLPVTEITQRYKNGPYDYTNNIWHGAYVFRVTTNGFEELGKVRHSSSTASYFEWWNAASVLRSLYMDNNLYTVSNKYVKINDLANGLELLNTIDLPYSENRNYWIY